MDEQPKKRPLSEISHLFLSSVRDMSAIPGVPRPRRTPPGKAPEKTAPEPSAEAPAPPPGRGDADADLTPEEYTRVFERPAEERTAEHEEACADDELAPVAPVTALIAAHLAPDRGGMERVAQYARNLAARVDGSVGLIELDASEFRLTCYDPAALGDADDAAADRPEIPVECYDPRQISEALEELNWDVRRWLLLLPNPRTLEAKALLRRVGHWVLLSTCDHDGVVSSYRMLKGLSDAADGSGASSHGGRPKLTLALLDPADDAERARVFKKLSGVCEQFLEWTLELEPAVYKAGAAAGEVVETPVLCCRPNRDKAQIATAPHWPVVTEFLARADRTDPADLARRLAAASASLPRRAPLAAGADAEPRIVADVIVPALPGPAHDSTYVGSGPTAEAVAPATEPSGPKRTAAAQEVEVLPMPTAHVDPAFPFAAPAAPTGDAVAPSDLAGDLEVLDLPSADAPSAAILAAVLSRRDGGLVECPLRAPMCPEARLAVARDRTVVLLAVARTGLADLRAVGRAYRWLMENRALIAMAMPQFALDPARPPRLHLLVDHVDASADVLRPMLETDHVTIQAYRRLKWGGKTGLLLEAA